MAVFKLGAIVTHIVGSIGGTTFRRGANSLIMQRKSFGTSRSRLLNNPRLGQIGAIFNAFRHLTIGEQEDWNAVAATIQFPDRFGDLKYLTGRQLYSKLNTQLLPVNQSIIDANEVDSTIVPITLVAGFADIDDPYFIITAITAAGTSKVIVQATVTAMQVITPLFTSRAVLASGTITNSNTVVEIINFLNYFPGAVAGNWVTYFVTTINDSGFKGSTLWVSVEIGI